VTATFVVPLNCPAGVTNASACGGTGEIPIGAVAGGTAGATACQNQCATQMAAAGMTSGCWIISAGNCFCRDGALTAGGGGALRGGGCTSN
jgi:hypothetical protein